MKSLKKGLILGTIGLCLISVTPEQKASADGGVTLGIIGTALGGTALGLHALNWLRGTGGGSNAMVHYPMVGGGYGGGCGGGCAMQAPTQIIGGCCSAPAPEPTCGQAAPCSAHVYPQPAPQQPAVQYVPVPYMVPVMQQPAPQPVVQHVQPQYQQVQYPQVSVVAPNAQVAVRGLW